MGLSTRIVFNVGYGVSWAFMGFGGGGLFSILVNGKHAEGVSILIFGIIGTLIGAASWVVSLRKQIKASRNRLRDQAYKEMVTNLPRYSPPKKTSD